MLGEFIFTRISQRYGDFITVRTVNIDREKRRKCVNGLLSSSLLCRDTRIAPLRDIIDPEVYIARDILYTEIRVILHRVSQASRSFADNDDCKTNPINFRLKISILVLLRSNEDVNVYDGGKTRILRVPELIEI